MLAVNSCSLVGVGILLRLAISQSNPSLERWTPSCLTGQPQDRETASNLHWYRSALMDAHYYFGPHNNPFSPTDANYETRSGQG